MVEIRWPRSHFDTRLLFHRNLSGVRSRPVPMRKAVTELNRHKAVGPDGLNNALYKDSQLMMVPTLVTMRNAIVAGVDIPPSFQQALIILLRKKEDSADTMDYRHISLCRRVANFCESIASRLQRIIRKLIRSAQEGFIEGHQMRKAVMMMLTQLTMATCDPG